MTTVEGPIPGVATSAFVGYDLPSLGYLEEEYFISGKAQSYELVGERGGDGHWTVAPAAVAAYKTRVIVRRPSDPATFNGSVVVEWNNVSGGTDVEADWAAMHRQILRDGFAWVGVSAQKAGIDGGGLIDGFEIKRLAPERYAGLDHPGDAYSYDMFTQAARLLRQPDGGGLLGPLVAERLIATGHSQSAAFLVTFVNAIDPLVEAFDGFLVHGRGATGSNLDGWGLLPGPGEDVSDRETIRRRLMAHPERIRDDARVPVLILQTETDVVRLGGGLARQPDSDRIRLWEIAGAAHADTYLLAVSRTDDGRLTPEEMAGLMAQSSGRPGFEMGAPMNSGPQQHYVSHAALAGLDRWVRDGLAPPQSPWLQASDDLQSLAVDDLGIARGGVRTPWVDVPVAALSGLGQEGADVFSFLFGTTRTFSAEELERLYPGGRSSYLAKFEEALKDALAKSFLLDADSDEIRAVAAAGYPG